MIVDLRSQRLAYCMLPVNAYLICVLPVYAYLMQECHNRLLGFPFIWHL